MSIDTKHQTKLFIVVIINTRDRNSCTNIITQHRLIYTSLLILSVEGPLCLEVMISGKCRTGAVDLKLQNHEKVEVDYGAILSQSI